MFYRRLLLSLALFAVLCSCAPPPQVQFERAQQADVHYQMGVSHLQNNDPTMALQELLKGVALAPKNHEIQAALGQAYQHKKAYSEAEQHYLQAIALSGNNPRYLNNIGSLYLDMKEWDKAIENFGKAADNLLFVSPHVALAGKGYAYLQKKDYPAALQEFQKAAETAPRYSQAYYLQSEAFVGMDKPELARKALEKAVSISPGYIQALYQLGVMEMKAQETDAAIGRFERIVELSPLSDTGSKAADMVRALKNSSPKTGEQ